MSGTGLGIEGDDCGISGVGPVTTASDLVSLGNSGPDSVTVDNCDTSSGNLDKDDDGNSLSAW